MSKSRMKNDPRRSYDTEFLLYPIGLMHCISLSTPKAIENESVVVTRSIPGLLA
jgi:hypothetical protein